MDMKKYIRNWEELTDEQQKHAKEQLKGIPGLNPTVVHPAAKFFEENGWVKIDKFRSKYNLFIIILIRTTRLNWMLENDINVNDHGYLTIKVLVTLLSVAIQLWTLY